MNYGFAIAIFSMFCLFFLIVYECVFGYKFGTARYRETIVSKIAPVIYLASYTSCLIALKCM